MHFDVFLFLWVYGCDLTAYWASDTDARCCKEFFLFVCVCVRIVYIHLDICYTLLFSGRVEGQTCCHTSY